ncbi:MAG: universal stress protein [Chloroflexi bacterium]|nr:universal stress protein [Chloroflexota bacterium]
MKIQRILVALDASPHSLAALEAAIDLAERLDAELQGLFVEDINLLRLAQLPFARELRYPLPGSQKVDTLHMEEQLRGQAAQAQRLFQQLAEDHKIKHSFTVVRGVVASSLLRATLKATCWCWGAPATRSFAPADWGPRRKRPLPTLNAPSSSSTPKPISAARPC